ncbi:unnamed protein product, partial [Ectocarpus sp. 13 AM-2016]
KHESELGRERGGENVPGWRTGDRLKPQRHSLHRQTRRQAVCCSKTRRAPFARIGWCFPP